MLNKIWFGLLLIGILYGFGKGAWTSARLLQQPGDGAIEKVEKVEGEEKDLGARNLQEVGKDLNAAIVNAATGSVSICIGLIGFMALWLGVLNIAKDAGMVDALARLLSPMMRWLFPEVPDGHPAQGAMLMNMTANMLGLDNAATPMGLKAMDELQTLNPHKDTASNSMATFLAINTSNITIIPFTIIGYRVLEGSTNPAGPIGGIILTTTVTTIVAVIATRLLSKSSRYALPATPASKSDQAKEPASESGGGA